MSLLQRIRTRIKKDAESPDPIPFVQDQRKES